jgi:hypothetical protein
MALNQAKPKLSLESMLSTSVKIQLLCNHFFTDTSKWRINQNGKFINTYFEMLKFFFFNFRLFFIKKLN